MRDYEIVQADANDIAVFESRVKDHLYRSWQLVGGPFVLPSGILCQAMRRFDDELSPTDASSTALREALHDARAIRIPAL